MKCVDDDLLTPENYENLRSSACWEIHESKSPGHSCNPKPPLPFFFADRRNFGEDYRKFEQKYNDTKMAWTLAQEKWTSGLGVEFD